MIEPGHPDLLVRRQCDLLALARSGLYYERRGESPENLQLMRLIDEAYTRWPFYGVRKMAAYLCREGHEVNVKRVRRLMCLMGLEAIYPRKRLGAPGEAHRRYPYLIWRGWNRAARSGVERRHHIHQAAEGVRVSRGDPGLV